MSPLATAACLSVFCLIILTVLVAAVVSMLFGIDPPAWIGLDEDD